MPNFFRLKKKAHFLHIGKTGGSAVKHVLRHHLNTSKYSIVLHSHEVSLMDVPKGEYVFFFLRNPLSRFVSGFYSRQRKGQPRYYSEWSPLEREVFRIFKTPNQLAAILDSPNTDQYMLAKEAMSNILHFQCYSNWYGNFEYFRSRQKEIIYVGFQESLDNDFFKLVNILEIVEPISLPIDHVAAHRNPEHVDKRIDNKGLNALTDWYSEDFKFIALCKELMSAGEEK